MQEKIEQALAVIDGVLAEAKHPAVMCSFGKDSMVLLDLVRQRRKDVAVIFHREPFFPRKYRFAQKVIEAWNLVVYDWPPGECAVQTNAGTGEIEVVRAYDFGGGYTCMVPVGIEDPRQGKAWLCAVRDLLERPQGLIEYRWDWVLHGHKSSDVDPILGAVPLRHDTVRHDGAASVAFPLRHWTDQDVWYYTLSRGLPIHRERYDMANGGREKEDKTYNPDYFAACTACVHPGLAQHPYVHCPLRGGMIEHQGRNYRALREPVRPRYIEEPKAEATI